MLNSAISLAEAGFSVIWLKYRSKAPVESKWSTQPVMTPADLEDTFEKGRNIGVRLGKWSRVDGFYLHALDMDIRDLNFAEDARDRVAEIARDWGITSSGFVEVISGSGGASRHLYFLTDKPFPSKKLWHTEESFVDERGARHWCAEIELFGTGKQVALPPSIHPDTLKEYQWERGDFDPRDLIDVDSALIEQMIGAEREYRYDEDVEPLGISYSEAEGYIANLDLDAWCEDRAGWVRLGMALHHEFDGSPEALDVWRQFSKKSRKFSERVLREQWKSFKVARDGEEVVTFASVVHASNEHVWLVDQETVAAEFDEEDDLPAPEKKRPRQRESGDRTDERRGSDGVPAHLLTIPGVLRFAVDHYNKTSTKTQPQFAVQAALALGSIVLGRNWCTNLDNFTSLYLVNLGATGSGKEFARTFVQKALEEAGVDSLVGPTRYASEAGFMSEALYKPRHVTIYDEFGRLLKSTGASSSTHQRDVQSIMMSAFGQLNGTIRPISYSTNNKTKEQIAAMRNAIVRRPAITLIGLSTPETFYDALSQEEVADGFLNRLLVVNSREQMKVERPRKWKRIPSSLRDWIADYVMPGDPDFGDPDFGEGENPTEPGSPIEVPFTDDAMERLLEIEQEVIDKMEDYSSRRLNGLWSRSKEIAQRIALIVALSNDQKKVRTRDLDWAWDYVRFYTIEMCDRAMEMLGAGPSVRIAREIAQSVQDAGRKGMAVRDMCKMNYTFDRMTPRDKDEVLDRLRTSHGIIKVKPLKKDGRGRPPSERFVHEDFIDD